MAVMRNNFLYQFFTLSCLLLVSFPALQANTLAEQRNYYDQAKQALDKGNPLPYYNYKKALQGYPLEPYLAYSELNIRLPLTSNKEVENFLAEHADLPQIKWLEMRWLRLVAQRADWSTFLSYYKPDTFSELDCFYGQYLYQQKRVIEANNLAKKLWLKPYSQPNSCDVVFETWEKHGKLTNDMRWQRLQLAIEAKEYKLANHLINQLPTNLKEQGKQLLSVAQSPSLISKTDKFQSKDHITSDIVGLGLRRLARTDPEQALTLLKYYGTRFNFSPKEQVALANDIGLTFARRFDPRALPILAQCDANLDHDDVSEWHIRLLLRLNRWQEAQNLIERLPETLAKTSRWRYWKVRTAQLINPNNPDINRQYKEVAAERDFYGFLSAQRSGAPYQFNHNPVIVNNNLVLKVKSTPAIVRALEFLDRDMEKEAWIEWNNASRHFSKQEMLALSQLAYDLQLYFYAIRTLAITSYWDDLTIRFPTAYRTIITKEADNRNINSNWAFAIMRQESAFKWNIKSHAGAMGLMQLMPGTAKDTAKRFAIPLAKPTDAMNPQTNIQLGTAFLSQMYGNLQSNRILASAAYNAGPGRVRQWLKNADHLDFDVWIETIPFNETRQYVQNVLFYSVIYGHKLNTPQQLIEDHEMNITLNSNIKKGS